MAISESTNFSNGKKKIGKRPIFFVECSYLNLYAATRGITISGSTVTDTADWDTSEYENIIIDISGIEQKIDPPGGVVNIDTTTIDLTNYIFDNQLLSDKVGVYSNYERQDIYIYIMFDEDGTLFDSTAADEADRIQLFKGKIKNISVEEDIFSISADRSNIFDKNLLSPISDFSCTVSLEDAKNKLAPVFYGDNRILTDTNDIDKERDSQAGSQSPVTLIHPTTLYYNYFVAGFAALPDSSDLPAGNFCMYDSAVKRFVRLSENNSDFEVVSNTDAAGTVVRTDQPWDNLEVRAKVHPEGVKSASAVGTNSVAWTNTANLYDGDYTTYSQATCGNSEGDKVYIQMSLPKFTHSLVDNDNINTVKWAMYLESDHWDNTEYEIRIGLPRAGTGTMDTSIDPSTIIYPDQRIEIEELVHAYSDSSGGGGTGCDEPYMWIECISDSASFATFKMYGCFLIYEYQGLSGEQLYLTPYSLTEELIARQADSTIAGYFSSLSTGDVLHNPVHILADFLVNFHGFSLDSASFEEIDGRYDYSVAFSLHEQENLYKWLDSYCEKNFIGLTMDEENNIRVFSFLPPSDGFTFESSEDLSPDDIDIFSEKNSESSGSYEKLSVRTPRLNKSDFYNFANKIELSYSYNSATDNFRYTDEQENSISSGIVGEITDTVENEFVSDGDGYLNDMETWLEYWLEIMSRKPLVQEHEGTLGCVNLELGDIKNIQTREVSKILNSYSIDFWQIVGLQYLIMDGIGHIGMTLWHRGANDLFDTAKTKVHDTSDIGSLTHAIGATLFTSPPVAYYNGVFYVAWNASYDDTYELNKFIYSYDISSDTITGTQLIGQPQNWEEYDRLGSPDRHCQVVVHVDQDGYIFTAFERYDNAGSPHNSYVDVHVSTSAETLSFPGTSSPTGSIEEILAYPQFHENSDGEIFLSARANETTSTQHELNIYKTVNRGVTWTDCNGGTIGSGGDAKFIDMGNSSLRCYGTPVTCSKRADGIHLAVNPRVDSQNKAFPRSFYVYSDDGITWGNVEYFQTGGVGGFSQNVFTDGALDQTDMENHFTVAGTTFSSNDMNLISAACVSESGKAYCLIPHGSRAADETVTITHMYLYWFENGAWQQSDDFLSDLNITTSDARAHARLGTLVATPGMLGTVDFICVDDDDHLHQYRLHDRASYVEDFGALTTTTQNRSHHNNKYPIEDQALCVVANDQNATESDIQMIVYS